MIAVRGVSHTQERLSTEVSSAALAQCESKSEQSVHIQTEREQP